MSPRANDGEAPVLAPFLKKPMRICMAYGCGANCQWSDAVAVAKLLPEAIRAPDRVRGLHHLCGQQIRSHILVLSCRRRRMRRNRVGWPR